MSVLRLEVAPVAPHGRRESGRSQECASRQVWGVRGSGARQGWAALVGIRAGKGWSEHAQGDREPTGNSRAGKLVPPQGEGGIHKGRGSGCCGGRVVQES